MVEKESTNPTGQDRTPARRVRWWPAAAGVGVVLLALAVWLVARPGQAHPHAPKDVEDAVQACHRCAGACQLLAGQWLGQSGRADGVAMALDLADVAWMTASLAARESSRSHEAADLCILLAYDLLEWVKQFPGDPHASRCVIECRRCIDRCQALKDADHSH